ncbi:MAG: arginine--tRNA ligase [Candidatus Amesbacteria bacterium]|nr:arginine--tRNA ligase [Candidatus Amesbacteria bacterium]
MLRDQLRQTIAEAAGVDITEVHLEHPNLETYGDYSTNVAIKKKLDAKAIAAKIPGATVAGPGFINITLTPENLLNLMSTASDLPNIGHGQTIIVEYSSPNIAKHFGIGHLRSTIIGQALYNLYEALGYKTIGDNHLGDWGTQFGKLLYMLEKYSVTEYDIDKLEELYIEFHKLAENDKSLENEARKWFKRLEDKDPIARELWNKCIQISMREFKRVYDLLNVQIDNAHGESFYEDKMPEVIKIAKGSIAVKSDGAWIIETGHDSPLMLLKSDGGTTYATRDLAAVLYRKNTFDPIKIIYEVGAEQTLYFAQLFTASKKMSLVSNDVELIHTKHGLYLASDGKKFSTRGGNTVKLDEVLEEAINRAKGIPEVGIGAIKYFDLLHGIQSNIVFDWDKILALQGNSGPYLQYTHARIMSVLAKNNSPLSFPSLKLREGVGGELNTEELSILRWIYKFPEVVEEAASRYSPNLLCNFIYELAQRYNTFYNKCSILSAQYSGEREFRLALTKSVGDVLKKGLNLLGISAPEKM